MAKLKTIYVCQNCGHTSSNWIGQCPSCGNWNSMVEDVISTSSSKSSTVKKPRSSTQGLVKLSEVLSAPPKRLDSGVGEFDRVLGGGFVSGQVVLLAGEPGIGKSTLLTEISKNLGDKKVLYVCGEESVEQTKLRALRMGYTAHNLLVFPETNVDQVIAEIEGDKDIELVIVDSIQTLYSDDLTGNVGSLVQVRGCTQLLTDTAKRTNTPIVLVGHVTKQGVVAGPKVLEHIVDTVLYLEGDNQHLFRILRTTKNRFGPVSEVGIFEMVEKGMREVQNPSELFLEQRLSSSPGSCVTVVMEGFRPLLFEIQALTTKTSFGYPRRTASGFSSNRLQVLIAILEKRARINLSNHDVYVSVAGGFKVKEYASDLAVCLAIASSIKDLPLKESTVAFGECGLSGEVRKVTSIERRSQEAERLGFSNVISPQNTKTLLEAINKAF